MGALIGKPRGRDNPSKRAHEAQLAFGVAQFGEGGRSFAASLLLRREDPADGGPKVGSARACSATGSP